MSTPQEPPGVQDQSSSSSSSNGSGKPKGCLAGLATLLASIAVLIRGGAKVAEEGSGGLRRAMRTEGRAVPRLLEEERVVQRVAPTLAEEGKAVEKPGSKVAEGDGRVKEPNTNTKAAEGDGRAKEPNPNTNTQAQIEARKRISESAESKSKSLGPRIRKLEPRMPPADHLLLLLRWECNREDIKGLGSASNLKVLATWFEVLEIESVVKKLEMRYGVRSSID